MTQRFFLTFFVCGMLGAYGQQFDVSKSWKEVALEHLSEDVVRELEKNEMVLVDEGKFQVFSSYINSPREPGYPFFITSDSLLHVFHVLLEDSVRRVEISNISSLQAFLVDAMAAFDKGAELISPEEKKFVPEARKKLSIILGVAAELLGGDSESWEPDASIRAVIDAEVEKVRQAQGIEMPDWLGKPRPEFLAIDYQKFKPAGPYQGSDLFSDYFRAVKWLQTVHLWLDRDEDYLALSILSKGLYPPGEIRIDEQPEPTVLTTISGLFGSKVSTDFTDFSKLVRDGISSGSDPFGENVELTGSLLPLRPKVEEKLLESHQHSRSNLRNREPGPELISIRFIPEFRLFDSNIFFHTAGPGSFADRDFPNGLEIAGKMGSAFAKSALRKGGNGNVVDWLEEGNVPPGGSELYWEYWDMISLLNEMPENAPDLFRNERWAAKTCETTLASWAHMRYLAALHSEQEVAYGSGVHGHPGFVEPNPDFFVALARLCEFIIEEAEFKRIFVVDANAQAIQLRKLAKAFRERLAILGSPEQKEEDDEKASKWMGSHFLAIRLLHDAGVKIAGESPLIHIGGPDNEDDLKLFLPALEKTALELESGTRPPTNDSRAEELRSRWRKLQNLCRDLQVIAIKQLHSIDLDRDEVSKIKNIGVELATLESYLSNSWLTPRDDAPRIVDIYHNPAAGGRLHVATGRPLTLYILYPYEGRKILCRGGVMTYFERTSANELNNADWMKLLDSPNPPQRPDWTIPIEHNK